MEPAPRLWPLGLCIALSMWGFTIQNQTTNGPRESCSEYLNCPSNAKCVNSTHCTCLDGFQPIGNRFFNDSTAVCDDINECLLPKPPDCGHDTSCVNEPGSYHCICANGYRSRSGKEKIMNASESDCEDIDECVGPNRTECGSHATCINVPGGYNCTCISGYKSSCGKANFKNESENDCQDIDECVGPNRTECGSNATCTNLPGSYNCTCISGYKSSSGKANFSNASENDCQDIDECVGPNRTECGSNATCTNLPGSYNCTCSSGYKLSSGKDKFKNANENDCQDIDECQQNATICEPHGNCINTPGSYMCKCKLGFGKSNKDPTKICIDIDECQRYNSTYPCNDNSTCINTLGSYSCVCAPGYFSANNSSPCKELTCPELLTGINAEAQTILGSFAAKVEHHCTEELHKLKQTMKWDVEAGKNMLQLFLDILESQLNTASLQNKSVEERHHTATRLMDMVEKVLRIMALALPENTTHSGTSHGTELVLAVRREGFKDQEAVKLQHKKTQIELKWTAAQGKKPDGFKLAGLLTYQGLRPVLEGAAQVEATEWKTIGQKNWWLREPGHPSYQVVSEVVSVFIDDPRPQGLSPSITLNFSHSVPESREEQHILCAYWEPKNKSWSTRGCKRLNQSRTDMTLCQCDHLSSFAVLMAFYEIEDWTLDIITKVGLVISLIGLLLSIITFLFCHAVKSPRTTIHLHLCLSLFIAYVIFLAGADSNQNKVTCGVVAGLLHYFFLAAFCWMCVEGAELYLMVVQVFAPHSLKRHYMFLLGYGAPAVIVGISAAAYSEGYGTKKHCWLSQTQGFIWSFLAPVCMIIAVNAVIFVVTVWKLAQKFTDINPSMGQLKKFRVITITAIAQLCILGLTWIFGMFQFNHRSLVVSYIFTILCSLQGLFIFLLHCLLKKQVRDEYRRWLCCGSLKYSEFSSSTASSTRKGLQPSQESGF